MNSAKWRIKSSNKNAASADRGGMGRRSFLRLGMLSAAATALISCKKPVEKAIPYLNGPHELTPGMAEWYASTCRGCPAGCGIIVKTREGRPIKIEGNELDMRTKGGLCAVGQASVMSLYDSGRLRGPSIEGRPVDRKTIDTEVKAALKSAAESGKDIYLLTGTINSPSVLEIIREFAGIYPDVKHVTYDAVSSSAMLEVHQKVYGRRFMPAYRFDLAEYILSIDADFLGTWLSPVEFSRQYASVRNPDDKHATLPKHIQCESRLSLTGSNSDKRIKLAPYEYSLFLLHIIRELERRGVGTADTKSELRLLLERIAEVPERLSQIAETTANELIEHQGKSLVVCGVNDVTVQLLTVFLNHVLGNIGRTVDVDTATYYKLGDEAELDSMLTACEGGRAGAVIVWGVNPAYSYPEPGRIDAALKNAPCVISMNCWDNESSRLAKYVFPDHHFLEAWGDTEVRNEMYILQQPVIRPLFKTRHAAESLLVWSGQETSYYDFLRNFWHTSIFPKQNLVGDFQEFWDNSVHDGIFQNESRKDFRPAKVSFPPDILQHLRRFHEAEERHAELNESGVYVELFESHSVRDGGHAQNPWLLELPDPVTKVTWENTAQISPELARKMHLKEDDMLLIRAGDREIEIPIIIQPGQHDAVISIGLGYGRENAGEYGSGAGVNAYHFLRRNDGKFVYSQKISGIYKSEKISQLAKTQTHDRMEGRPIARETAAEDVHSHRQEDHDHALYKLWGGHGHEDHLWAMAIDLNKCTGCGACLIACQAENNIAVVGKDEVRRQREMHWIRIDRYYEGDEENPKVVFQPMMCQQCENASCETVCPVLATVHGDGGLNVQVYNRCIGTRYCANNCPYKVRRFNWLSYRRDDPLANLVLNPDVTVRSRGVMEKCTFCIQRIQEKKIAARNERRVIRDGEIKTACQQSCPAGAIVFGDVKDSNSKIHGLMNGGRAYRVLEELNLDPSVTYLANVRNEL